MDRVKCGFKDMPVANLLMACQWITNRLEQQPYAEQIEPNVIVVKEIIYDLREIQALLMRGDLRQTKRRNHLVAQLKFAMQRWQDFVNWKCAGDIRMLVSSGFPLERKATKKGIPAKVNEIKIELTNSSFGKKMYWTSSKKKAFYEVEKSYKGIGSDAEWLPFCSTTDNAIAIQRITGKVEAVNYRVRAVNAHGGAEWSISAECFEGS